jgi:hypothetical protein
VFTGRQQRGRSRVWLVVLILVCVVVSSASATAARSGQAAAKPPSVVVKVDRGGFRWEDAGIGAAAALAVVLLVQGLALVLRTQRSG